MLAVNPSSVDALTILANNIPYCSIDRELELSDWTESGQCEQENIYLDPQHSACTGLYTSCVSAYHTQEATDFLQQLLNEVCELFLDDEADCLVDKYCQCSSVIKREHSLVTAEMDSKSELTVSELGPMNSTQANFKVLTNLHEAERQLSIIENESIDKGFRDMIDHVVISTSAEHSQGEISDDNIFGDLALPIESAKPEIRAETMIDECVSHNAACWYPNSELPPTSFYHARALLKMKFYCWTMHNAENLPTNEFTRLARSSFCISPDMFQSSRTRAPWSINSSQIVVSDGCAKLMANLCDSVIWPPVSVTLHLATQRNIRRFSKASQVRKQEYRVSRALSKLRTPYKLPSTSYNGINASYCPSDHIPGPVTHEGDEARSTTLHNQQATTILRKPFRKHVLSPRPSYITSDNACISHWEEETNSMTDTSSSSDPLVLHASPKARRPFKRLTLAPITEQVEIQNPSWTKNVDRSACCALPEFAEPTIVEASKPGLISQRAKRRKVASELFFKSSHPEANHSSHTVSAKEDGKEYFSREQVSTTVTVFDTPATHLDSNVLYQKQSSGLCTSAGPSKLYSDTSATYSTDNSCDCSAMPTNAIVQSRAHLKHILHVMPFIKTAEECAAQLDVPTSSEGWETANGTKLHLAHDPTLAAEWSQTTIELRSTDAIAVTDSQQNFVSRNKRRDPLLTCKSSSSSEKALFSDQLDLRKRQLKLKEDLKLVESALRCEGSQDTRKLETLIRKWRAVAHDVCDEYFVYVNRRVNDAGGVKAWYKAQNLRPWFDTAESELAACREAETMEYELSLEEKRLMDSEEEYFTMDLLLRGLGIPMKLIGWNSETEQWI